MRSRSTSPGIDVTRRDVSRKMKSRESPLLPLHAPFLPPFLPPGGAIARGYLCRCNGPRSQRRAARNGSGKCKCVTLREHRGARAANTDACSFQSDVQRRDAPRRVRVCVCVCENHAVAADWLREIRLYSESGGIALGYPRGGFHAARKA